MRETSELIEEYGGNSCASEAHCGGGRVRARMEETGAGTDYIFMINCHGNRDTSVYDI